MEGSEGGSDRRRGNDREERSRGRMWQLTGREPSSECSRYGQCAETNDVISAWIDVCTVPLRGALPIN